MGIFDWQKLNRKAIDNTITNKVFLIVLFIAMILSISTNTFLTSRNLFNLLRQITVNAIVASGFTLIIAAKEIDLSIGHLLAFLGVIMAKLLVGGWPIPLAILAGIIIGILCGMGSAFVITKFTLPSFIVTLAMQSVFRGTTYLVTNMKPVAYLPESFVFIGQGYIGTVPVTIFMMILVIFIMYFIVNLTSIGRHSVAMGGDSEAARVCGINIFATRLFVFGVGGFCAALGAVVMTARTASAQIAAGDDLAMDAIAAVVIGGTSMYGGNANIIGTFFGCLVVGVVNNGLNLLGVNPNWQIIAKGVLILVAVLLDTLTTKYYEYRAGKQTLKDRVET
jgi:ribose/xylose/arabinose/galactoside ABC-type transport system permease subunit